MPGLAEKFEIDILPRSFKLQWHITERCNFRCRHCYQENYNTPELTLEQLDVVLNQYVELLKKWQIPRNRAFLTITGGEPFLRRDFFQFLGNVYKNSENFIWSILSNGSLISRENIKILKSYNIGAFQVSLEGMERNNDEIRGEGNFKKALEGVKLLIEEGVYTVVSMTFTKENVKDVSSLAFLLAEIGVKDFLVRRLVPWGVGSQLKDSLLSSTELLDFYKEVEKLGHQLYRKGYKMKISLCCESPFFNKQMGSEPSSLLYKRGDYCAVTRGIIMALLPNGDVLPCRRLPIKIGNILESSFEKIYYSPQMVDLRNTSKLSERCQECLLFNRCFGGARCITYACTNRLDLPDPQCWHSQKLGIYFKILKKIQSFQEILKKTEQTIKNRLSQ